MFTIHRNPPKTWSVDRPVQIDYPGAEPFNSYQGMDQDSWLRIREATLIASYIGFNEVSPNIEMSEVIAQAASFAGDKKGFDTPCMVCKPISLNTTEGHTVQIMVYLWDQKPNMKHLLNNHGILTFFATDAFQLHVQIKKHKLTLLAGNAGPINDRKIFVYIKRDLLKSFKKLKNMLTRYSSMAA